jgi:hypothetical protein
MLCDVTDTEKVVPLNAGKSRSPMARIKSAAKPGRETLPKSKRAKPAEPADTKPAEKADAKPNGEADAMAETASDKPSNDMTPLPASDGPYGLQLADPVAQHSIVETALGWSEKIGARVAIVSAAGKQVRVIDGRIGGKRSRVERNNRAPRPSGVESKRGRCAALLLREQGATQAELTDILGRSASLVFINKLARIHEAGVETLGDKQWRLVKK